MGTLLTLHAALLWAAPMGGKVLPCAEVDRSHLHSRVFSSSWQLPPEVWRPSDPAHDLASHLAALVAERRPAPTEQPWVQSLGDLVLEHRRRGGTSAALAAVRQDWKALDPSGESLMGDVLAQLLDATAISDRRWDPADDLQNDGILMGRLIERRSTASAPWNDLGGSRHFHQAAVLVRADLDAILQSLHDYPSALKDRGTSYEKLAPRPESIVFGSDEQNGPFAALRLAIRSDLPFPFTHYDCDLGILHGLDLEGNLLTYVFGSSRDFYWLAGRDVHIPVRSASGEWVATLIARISGFDLRGVPDDDDDRKSGTRAALGNLKRRAEAAFAAAGGEPRTVAGAIPPLVVVAP